MSEIEKIIESISPNERKIIPFLEEKKISEICKKSNLDKVSVLRSLEYLQAKKIVELDISKKKIVDVSVNGALYRKKGLPERRLMLLLGEKHIIPLKDAQKEANLSSDEFKASLGALKKKALIDLKNGKIVLNASKEELTKKTLEEIFLEILPIEEDLLTPEQKFALKSLQKRKNIIQIEEQKKISITITNLGKEIMQSKELGRELIEQITPKLLKSEKNWKGKKFRRYDINANVPKINGGKRHFVNSAIDYIKKIWTEMGFVEETGEMLQSSFWNFDALFQPQDHPARELADTFFINKNAELPNKKIVQKIKDAHEKGIDGSKGWNYKWDEEVSKQLVLRTHTTAVTSKTLSEIKEEDLPLKLFSVGKCFRNETVDWCHGFEFYQTEGVVIDPNANFTHLLGYLKQFYKKMGFEKVRFRPAYFPYTEPSVEVDVWHPEKKVWLELGGAGILRPEVSVSLLGKNIPILAWGQGVDRIIMDFFKIKDLRELYKNDITQLREMKAWTKI